jgi:integrase
MTTLETNAVSTANLIRNIRTEILSGYGQLYLDVFDIGITVGLRGGDLLKIMFDNVNHKKREIRVIEQKTGNLKVIPLSDKVIGIIKRRRAENPDDLFLFKSKHNRTKNRLQPLCLSSLNKVLADIGKQFGLKLSSNSLKEIFTFGVTSQNLQNRSLVKTLKKPVITQEEILQCYDDVIL